MNPRRHVVWPLRFTIVGTLALTALVLTPSRYFAYQNDQFAIPKTAVLGLGVLVCAVLLAHRIRIVGARVTWLHAVVAAYFTVGVASWLVNGGLWMDLLVWLGFEGSAAVLFFASATLARAEGSDRVSDALIVIALLLATVTAAEALGAAVPWSHARRPVSTLGNRNLVGAYMAIVLPLAVARLSATRSGLNGAAVALLSTCIVLTRCRSAWLGLLMAAMVTSVAAIARRRQGPLTANRGVLFAAGALVLGAAIAVAVPWPGLRWSEGNSAFAATAHRLIEHDQGSGKVRLDQLSIAWKAASMRPLGFGPNHWDDASSAVAGALGGEPEIWHGNPTPSSDVVRVLANLGIPGVLLSGVVWVLLLGRAIHASWFANRTPWLAPCLAALVVATTHSALDAPLFRAPMIALLAVVAGIVHGATPPAARAIGVPSLAAATCAITFGVACSIAPVLGCVAGRVAGTAASIARMRSAQAIFPRIELSEQVARSLVEAGRCNDAQAELRRLFAWTPHHVGPYQLGIGCAEKAGDKLEGERLEAIVRGLKR